MSYEGLKGREEKWMEEGVTRILQVGRSGGREGIYEKYKKIEEIEGSKQGKSG